MLVGKNSESDPRGSLRWGMAGFIAIIAGFIGVRAPTVLVARGEVSLFDTVRSIGPLLFVRGGCPASRRAYDDWKEDPDLRNLVTPVTINAPSGQDDAFEVEICDAAVSRASATGSWWVNLVDRDVACASLWSGARDFATSRYLVAWPQFASEDRMVRSHDPEELRALGLVEVCEDGRPRYRVASSFGGIAALPSGC